LLMERKMYHEADDVVKKISQYFPSNPKRLAGVIRLAVMTQKVEDMEKYYHIFTHIETKSPELTKSICAGLIVCGRYYLRSKNPSRALDLFTKVAVSAGSESTKFLKEIVISLESAKMIEEAKKFLNRYPAEFRGQADYLSIEYLISSKALATGMVIDRGRNLIKEGVNDPIIYKTLLEASIVANQVDYAETVLQDAIRKWPQSQADFEKIIADTNKLRAA
jgi:tetratricopeptide (TPR) repeat protein